MTKAHVFELRPSEIGFIEAQIKQSGIPNVKSTQVGSREIGPIDRKGGSEKSTKRSAMHPSQADCPRDEITCLFRQIDLRGDDMPGCRKAVRDHFFGREPCPCAVPSCFGASSEREHIQKCNRSYSPRAPS